LPVRPWDAIKVDPVLTSILTANPALGKIKQGKNVRYRVGKIDGVECTSLLCEYFANDAVDYDFNVNYIIPLCLEFFFYDCPHEKFVIVKY